MFTILSTISTGLEITAILFALNFLANSIRFTYNFIASIIRFIRFITPHIVHFILVTADFISWVNSFIDWQFVFETVIETIKSVAVVAYVAGKTAGEFFYSWHANHVGSISYAPQYAPAAVNPMFEVAQGMNVQTVKNLRKLGTFKSRQTKGQIIAQLLATV